MSKGEGDWEEGKKETLVLACVASCWKGRGEGAAWALQHPVSFSFSKLKIFIPEITDFHFVSFHFLSLHLVSQSTVSLWIILCLRSKSHLFQLHLFSFKSHHFCSILLHFCFGYKIKCKTFSFPLFYKPATCLNKHWYWLNSAIWKWLVRFLNQAYDFKSLSSITMLNWV